MNTLLSMPMVGHLANYGLQGGFLRGELAALGMSELPPSIPIITRGLDAAMLSPELREQIDLLQRGDVVGDVNQLVLQLSNSVLQMQRAITSQTSNLPVRENLEAEAKVLVPIETPVRNRLPRTMGSGTSSSWIQVLSLGGGYTAATTSTSSGNTSGQANISVASAAGIIAGDTLLIGSGGTLETKLVSSVNYSTNVITLTANLANTQNSVAVVKTGVQGGSPQGVIRAFFPETGAPADHSTQYARPSAAYKLLGSYGSVTGFAIAAGANFQNQLAYEKGNAIKNLMLNEENALINGDATNVYAPWGDGTTNYAFAGLINLIATANGTPAAQVQTGVGNLTTAHIDAQLNRLFLQGAQGYWMLMNPQECASLAHLAEANGSMYRVMFAPDGKGVLGVAVTGYVHPTTQEIVPILPSRFIAPGTIIYGCDRLPDGTPAADVNVLPQVQLPVLAPNENVQGYTAQDIAPTTSAPQVYPFMVSCYEVLRMKSAVHFAISKGVAAV